MNELPVEWILGGAAVLALGLVLCAGILVAMLVSLRRLRRDRDTGQRQLAAMKKALLELGRHQRKTGRSLQRIASGQQQLNRRVEVTRRQQQELEMRDIGNVTYSHASRLVEMGADCEDLVTNCGLSQAEARLISMMGRRTEPQGERVA